MKAQTRSRNIKISLMAGLVSGLLCGAQAQAHVVELYYDSFGGFVQGTENPSSPAFLEYDGLEGRDPHSLDGDPTNDAYTTVEWGFPTVYSGQFPTPQDPQSGLTLVGYDTTSATNPAEQYTVQTGSGILVPMGDLIHQNEPISGTPLDGVTISWNLQLYEDAADAAANNTANAAYTVNATFDLDIWETPNDPAFYTSGICPNANPDGTDVGTGVNGADFIADGTQVTTNPCDDAFAYSPITGFTDTFDLHGETYEVVLSGFWTETSNGELVETFWSPEGDTTTGYVLFELRQIPVSGPLGLMLIGLASLGLATRRRRLM